jgi:hypothetical protein
MVKINEVVIFDGTNHKLVANKIGIKTSSVGNMLVLPEFINNNQPIIVSAPIIVCKVMNNIIKLYRIEDIALVYQDAADYRVVCDLVDQIDYEKSSETPGSPR